MKNGAMNDFQKSFLARGTGQTLFTQKEFDDELAVAKAQIMQVAIETTKTAIALEREECAKVCEEIIKGLEGVDIPLSVGVALDQCAKQIRNRMKK
jgi:hypothetical protein